VIQSKLGADNRITGRFTTQEADELSKILKAGALPASLKYLQELTVGASLGRDSIRDGVRASAAAMAFIAIFMLFYYRLSGVNAVVALAANLLILLAAMAYTDATLTLPGIAGIILTVGASLGRDSIRDGIRASTAAMAFIAIFMLVYYRLSGLNAIVALAANLLIVLAAMAYTNATLTLPGIAGIILTVGVGVDTNVLVFERIREELRNGKTVRAAVQNGFDRVWITILDTHATALIAAAFLFQFGTGPIKGFAVTLVIGLVANVFASYFVSKFLFEWVLGKRHVESLSI
jgi:preprotein translocase subunit SecD